MINPPIRIGIDGFNLAMFCGTGISTYARVLSQTLTKMGHPVDVLYGLNISPPTDSFMREVAFFDRLGQENKSLPPVFASRRWFCERWASRQGVEAVQVPITGVVDHRSFQMPAFDRIFNVQNLFALASRHFHRNNEFLRLRIPNPPAVMHWTYAIPIRLEGARNIYTIHDLVPLRLPHTTLDDKNYHHKLVRACIREGNRICTVSEASRHDIEHLFPEAVGQVTNTYQAINFNCADVPSVETLDDFLKGMFGLQPRGYFLFFGSIEPKKNIGRLIEGYLSSGSLTPLLIVGAQSWRADRELNLLNLCQSDGACEGRAPHVRQIEYLPVEILLKLIRGARAVLFPSIYEGFGLPVLEAMALGTATLTSTEASLPEIAGNAALMVDPYDIEDIACGIRKVDNDASFRTHLQKIGPTQAAQFSQELYSKKLTALYRSVI